MGNGLNKPGENFIGTSVRLPGGVRNPDLSEKGGQIIMHA